MPQDALAAAAAAGTEATPVTTTVDPVKAAAEAAAAGAVQEVEAPPPAVEKVVDPEPGRISALQRSIQQRERTIVAKQQELAQRERQLGESVSQQVERAVAERMAGFKTDPIAALKALGYDEQTIATRLLKGNAPQPEEVAQKALRETEDIRKQLQETQRRNASQAAERDFLAEATNGDKYEHIPLEWEPAELVREARGVVDQLRQRGIDPSQYTMADISKFLDQRAKARGAKRDALKAERAKKAGSQDPTKAASNGIPAQGDTAGKTASTTTLGKGLGARQSLNGKPGHLMTNAELEAAVEAEVARARAG